MLQPETLRSMLMNLLKTPGFSVNSVAKKIGVHEETLRKVQQDQEYQLVPAKQLALIKLYCSQTQMK